MDGETGEASDCPFFRFSRGPGRFFAGRWTLDVFALDSRLFLLLALDSRLFFLFLEATFRLTTGSLDLYLLPRFFHLPGDERRILVSGFSSWGSLW